MSSPMQLRHALRRLIKRPGFTVTAVLSLAIGIGANTAIFSLIDTIVLRDKAFADPTGLVELYPMEDQSYGTFSYPEFQVLRRGTENVFSQLAASQMTLVQLAGETAVDTVVGELVSGDYFPILGLDAALGRTLLPEDDLRPGGHPVVVLSHQHWQQRYGGQEDVVGREIRLSGYPFTVVGVAPATYQGNFRGIAPSFYIPFQMINQITPVAAGEDGLQQWGNHSLFVRARIAPGSTLQGARAAVDGVAAELRESYSAYWSPDHRIRLMASEDVILFPPIDRFLRASAWLLMTVVGLVLLITCANLASFLLAQATDRRKEMALRLALGARQRNIVGKLLAESMLLSTLGGLGGIGLGMALLRLLGSADLPLPLPIALDLGMNPKVLLFSIGVTLLAGVFFGLVPALQSARSDMTPALKLTPETSGRGRRFNLRALLVSGQVAVTLVLLVASGLFLRSLQATLAVDPGFGQRPAALFSFGLPPGTGEEQGRLIVEDLLARISRIPGVETVGVTANLQLNTLSQNSIGVNVDGVEPPEGREAWSIDYTKVDADFFGAAGIQILEGRNFALHDLPESPRVAIVSATLAERFFPDGAIGRMLRRNDNDLEIVGIASDTKVRSLGESPLPFMYLPFSQSYTEGLTVVAATSVDPEPIAVAIFQLAREAHPDLWLWESKTMARHLGIVALPTQLAALLLTAFAGVALLLATIGLYGLISYAVASRTREVGIRISLGADRRSVVRLLMSGGLRLVAIGGAVGLVVAWLAAQAAGGLLFGVEASDPLTFVVVAAVLATTAALAAWIPARRATRINPVSALRLE